VELKNRVAIITGATGGIGKAIALAYASAGARTVLASRNRDKLDKCAEEIRSKGGLALVVPTDVARESQVTMLFERALQEWGQLDILVNSAGIITTPVPTEESLLNVWQSVIDVNVTGTYLCCREALKVMKRRKSGRIINIGSLSATVARPDSAAYTTSKFAVEGLTRSLARDGRAHGVAVSIIQPGSTKEDGAATNNGYVQSPNEVAKLAVLMAALPSHVNLLEAVVLPLLQPSFLGRG